MVRTVIPEARRLVNEACSLVWIIFLLLGGSSPARAEVALDGTLGPSGPLTGPDFVIGSEMGQTRGSNLFHSFSEFNLTAGESATFSGPATIGNVISRVTGGSVSSIDGLIRSAIDGANFYFINPQGMLFGPNASLDVSGSFYVSTADVVRFGDDGTFLADPVGASVLSSAPPVAFGFLGDTPAGISVDGSTLEVPEGETLCVVGGDVTVTGAGESIWDHVELSAPGGRIDIASAATSGDVAIGGAAPVEEAPAAMGSVSLSGNGYLVASGNGGGTVVIRGGQIYVENGAIYASATGDATAASGVPGEGVRLQATESVVLSAGSEVGSMVAEGQAADSGPVVLEADRVVLEDGALVLSRAYQWSTGRAGGVVVRGDEVLVTGGGQIMLAAEGATTPGPVRIEADRAEFTAAGNVWSYSWIGTAAGGDIEVLADELVLEGSGDPFAWPATGLGAFSYSAAPGGGIRIDAGSVTLSQGANIDASPWGAGPGGDVEIVAQSIMLADRGLIDTRSFGTGDAGSLAITAESLDMRDGGGIWSDNWFGAGGRSGDVVIDAGDVTITGYASTDDPFINDFTGIKTISRFEGDAGDVTITADTVTLDSRAQIDASSFGPGRGGDVQLDIGRLNVRGGSAIIANAFGAADAGDITVSAESVEISGAHPEPFVNTIGILSLAPSAIAAQSGFGGGSGGTIGLTATSLEISDGGRIATDTFGNGAGGGIELDVGRLSITGENQVMKEFFSGEGEGGVGARSGVLTGANDVLGVDSTAPGGEIRIRAETLHISEDAWISSRTETSGTGGKVSVLSGDLQVETGGEISAASVGSHNGAGTAGEIELVAEQMISVDDGTVSTASSEGAGGSVSLEAEWIQVRSGGVVSAEALGSGDGGAIRLTADAGITNDAGLVTSSAEVSRGGDITLEAPSIRLINGSLVLAESAGAGDAGSVTLSASGALEGRDSSVSTEAREADGGNITIEVGDRIYLVDSKVTASVGGGVATTGGNVTIDPRFVILRNSRIAANAFEGAGGNVGITTEVFLADPDSSVDASSQLGIDGSVEIQAVVSNISGVVTPLPEDFRSASDLLRESCLARAEQGSRSSLVLGGRDAVPPQPGQYLPSPVW